MSDNWITLRPIAGLLMAVVIFAVGVVTGCLLHCL